MRKLNNIVWVSPEMAGLFVYNDYWVIIMVDKEDKDNTIRIRVNADSSSDIVINTEQMQKVAKSIEMINRSFNDIAGAALENINLNLQQLDEIAQNFHDRLEAMTVSAREYYPSLQAAVDSVNNAGWPIGVNFDNDVIISCSNLESPEINKRLTEFYTKNNYNELFQELDLIIENMSGGYRELIKSVKAILKNNINDFTAVMPTLYSLIDYSYNLAFGRNQTASYARIGLIRIDAKKSEEDNLVGLYEILATSTYKILLEHFSYHSFEPGVDETDFSRGTVMHGRYNPDRMSKQQLIQIVLLLSAVQVLG